MPFWTQGSSLSTWRNKCFHNKIHVSSFKFDVSMSIRGCRTLLHSFMLDIFSSHFLKVYSLHFCNKLVHISFFFCYFVLLHGFSYRICLQSCLKHIHRIPWSIVLMSQMWNQFLEHSADSFCMGGCREVKFKSYMSVVTKTAHLENPYTICVTWI